MNIIVLILTAIYPENVQLSFSSLQVHSLSAYRVNYTFSVLHHLAPLANMIRRETYQTRTYLSAGDNTRILGSDWVLLKTIYNEIGECDISFIVKYNFIEDN